MRFAGILAVLLGMALGGYAVASALTLGFAADDTVCDANGISVVTWDVNGTGTVFGITLTDVDPACQGDSLYVVIGTDDLSPLADALATLDASNTGTNDVVMTFTEVGDSTTAAPQFIPDVTSLQISILGPVTSDTPTATATGTVTATVTPTTTDTPTATATGTLTATVTPTATVTLTATVTPTATDTPTPTPTGTLTATVTPTGTLTTTVTVTATPTTTSTATPTFTPTATTVPLVIGAGGGGGGTTFVPAPAPVPAEAPSVAQPAIDNLPAPAPVSQVLPLIGTPTPQPTALVRPAATPALISEVQEELPRGLPPTGTGGVRRGSHNDALILALLMMAAGLIGSGSIVILTSRRRG